MAGASRFGFRRWSFFPGAPGLGISSFGISGAWYDSRHRVDYRRNSMPAPRSDAFVFFGATGDLAYKKIFPALQAMVKRRHLDMPIVGVAKAGWTLEQFQARARDSVEQHGGLDATAFPTLSRMLRYVDGDYRAAATFAAIREQLGPAQRPAYYLAIPATLFPVVVDQLRQLGCRNGARVIVEKPFGRDLPSARSLNRTLFGCFDEST